MLKLIINLPCGMNADLLMTSALALADYKSKHYYKFSDVQDGLPEYGDMDLPRFLPNHVIYPSPVNHNPGMVEYEVLGYMLDVNLMERLTELQGLIPFEMHFEQRGKYDPDACKDLDLGDIYDPALESLFNTEATA